MQLTDQMSFAIGNVELSHFTVSAFARQVMFDYEAEKLTGNEAANTIKQHYGHPNIAADKAHAFEGDITSFRMLELQYHPVGSR
jgi:hypothetical protein